ncbi:MAG TPA: hypothetical protein VK530_13010 [Candidatus Acidoferrum sp.]|nr:hypothetical protein [Candidatus Acidoferrum sp.]
MRAALLVTRRPENVFLWLYCGAWAIQAIVMEYYEIDKLSKRTETIATFLLSFGVAYWVMCDSRRRGMRRPFIFGYFLMNAWPLIAPWHLFRTRGWRAFITLGIFVIVLLLAVVLPAFVASLISRPTAS